MLQTDENHESIFVTPQLNVCYNVWGAVVARRRRDSHNHEAFHLSVELLDFDHHAAHLLVCYRSGGEGGGGWVLLGVLLLPVKNLLLLSPVCSRVWV